ncbi:MAG: helix-turn-helix transcriptional regulator [Holophagaceae bacterium]
MSLMEALQSRPALTVDEVAKLGQALGISLSWLLWGVHGARFGAEPTIHPQPQFPEIPEEVIEDKRAYDELHPTSIRARYERLHGLIASQKSLGGLAKRAGVPEAAIHGYLHGKRTLTLSEVRNLARACKSNMRWILTGDSSSTVEQVSGSLGNVASGLAGIVSLGFSAWLQERQRDGMVQGTMRYLKTKSLVELLPSDENHLDLTNDEVEARLSQLLNPEGFAESGLLDWDSIDHARFILEMAGIKRGDDRESYASLFRTAYQHAMEQSISGLPPDEDFIERLANLPR